MSPEVSKAPHLSGVGAGVGYHYYGNSSLFYSGCPTGIHQHVHSEDREGVGKCGLSVFVTPTPISTQDLFVLLDMVHH